MINRIKQLEAHWIEDPDQVTVPRQKRVQLLVQSDVKIPAVGTKCKTHWISPLKIPPNDSIMHAIRIPRSLIVCSED